MEEGLSIWGKDMAAVGLFLVLLGATVTHKKMHMAF